MVVVGCSKLWSLGLLQKVFAWARMTQMGVYPSHLSPQVLICYPRMLSSFLFMSSFVTQGRDYPSRSCPHLLPKGAIILLVHGTSWFTMTPWIRICSFPLFVRHASPTPVSPGSPFLSILVQVPDQFHVLLPSRHPNLPIIS